MLSFLLWTGAATVRGAEPGAPAAAAPELAPLAVIVGSVGSVAVTKAGDPDSIPAEEDLELEPGDRINTGSNGSVTISLRDEHFVKLGGQATLTIKELRTDQVTGGIWARLALTRGLLMAVVSSLTSPDSRFEVDTPTAIAAVKGTSFQVAAGGKSTSISVLEGSVAASGFREASVQPEEVEVKEGFETVVDGKTRRPGPLTKFFNNEKRKKARIALSEFKAKMRVLKSQGQSGELQRRRRQRVLSRAMLVQRFEQRNPQAFKSLPEWRRNRLDRFLSGHRPELDASRAEISRYLNSNPKTRKRLELEVGRYFAGAKAPAVRPAKKARTAGKKGASRKPRAANPPSQ
jgi:hypothetical protein